MASDAGSWRPGSSVSGITPHLRAIPSRVQGGAEGVKGAKGAKDGELGERREDGKNGKQRGSREGRLLHRPQTLFEFPGVASRPPRPRIPWTKLTEIENPGSEDPVASTGLNAIVHDYALSAPSCNPFMNQRWAMAKVISAGKMAMM